MLKQQLQEAYANRFAYVPDYAPVLKFDPAQPRDAKGRWSVVVGGEPIGLAAEARKAPSFEEFEHDYLGQIKHGLYWHLTDNPQFAIDLTKGPRDMSSMGGGGTEAGALMVTSHLENWDDYYNTDPDTGKRKVTRPFAVAIDLADVPRKDYRQISRGFGNEFFIPDASKAKVLRVVPVKDARRYDKRHHSALPQSSEELRAFYDKVRAQKYDPAQPRDDQGQWTTTGASGRSFTSEEGYEWHEQGPGRAWAKTLRSDDADVIGSYAGFTYRQINELRRGKPPTHEAMIRNVTAEEYAKIKEVDRLEQLTPPEGPETFYSWSFEHLPKDKPGPIHLMDHYAVRGQVPDPKRHAEITQKADLLDDLIANRGLVLEEPITVIRGAYLPGVSIEQLQDMANNDAEWEEKGFTSTMLGEAGGRARSYPALGKWESLHQRYGSSKSAIHQDEVGTAVQFHITLPEGTKVASVEAARRVQHRFPRIQDPAVFEHPEWTADGKTRPEDYTVSDYTQTPTIDTRDLERKEQRTESEILLGSGARFRVTKVLGGYTYNTNDPSLKPVRVYEVHLEYIGGGSSDGRQRS